MQNGSPASLAEVKSAVYEQWLYSDIKESGEAFLPFNLRGIQAQFVRGDFCLQVSSRPGQRHHEHVLYAFYIAVQVNSVLNVAASAYSQLQKVRGQELDEAEDASIARQNKVWCMCVCGGMCGHHCCPLPPVWNVKGGGGTHLLYLELTDGKQTVHAMEYQSTGPVISADLDPGAKVEHSTTSHLALVAILLQLQHTCPILGLNVPPSSTRPNL